MFSTPALIAVRLHTSGKVPRMPFLRGNQSQDTSTADPALTALPEAAAQRVERLASSESTGAFTSDLSVDEHLLVTQAGYEPVGYVMGTSIYHVGIQVAGWKQSQELTVLSQAMYNARELAIERMKAEAEALKADGVIGLELRIQMYAWGQDVMEFVAQGTAIRSMGSPGSGKLPDGSPFTSDLSGQDFFTLLKGGHFPVRLVLGSCVYHVAHQSAMQALRQTGQNQEIATFTEAVYTARELAMTRMQAEADAVQAHSIVGVRATVSNHVWGEHATEFLAIGTAVLRAGESLPTNDVTLTLPLTT
jgi:uncharacterized protein YbjQ (UPF0145 family)